MLRPSTDGNADLSCSIEHASLQDEPYFEALSYVWGDASQKQRIYIDGSYLGITGNLGIALRYLRHRTDTRTLWIDAISINQNDIPERGSQVQIMREIYSSASKVVAWLGESNEGDERGLKIVEYLAERNRDSVEDFQEGFYRKTPEELGIMLITQFQTDDWYGLRKIWDRPYWKRVWVVQELAVSYGKAVMAIGHQSYPVEAFYKAFHLNLVMHPAIQARGDPSWCGDLLAIAAFQDRDFHSLLGLLHQTTFFQATDRRDKIYALLGLSNRDADRLAIFPDYKKSLDQLCREVVKYLIASNDSLAILHGNRRTAVADGPSWIPRFHDPIGTPLWTQNSRSFDTAWSSKPQIKFSHDLQHLGAQGFAVGTVGTTYGPFENPFHIVQDDSFEQILEMEHAAMKTLSRGAEMSDDDARVFREAFWRTLIGNHGFIDTQLGRTNTTLTQYPAPAEYAELYETLVHRAEVPPDFEPEKDEFTRWTDYMWPYWTAMQHQLRDRSFFAGKDRYIGVGPQGTKVGDIFVVLFGSSMPLILREVDKGYMLIGDAYVHGIMDGQLMALRESFGTGDLPTREFVLV